MNIDYRIQKSGSKRSFFKEIHVTFKIEQPFPPLQWISEIKLQKQFTDIQLNRNQYRNNEEAKNVSITIGFKTVGNFSYFTRAQCRNNSTSALRLVCSTPLTLTLMCS